MLRIPVAVEALGPIVAIMNGLGLKRHHAAQQIRPPFLLRQLRNIHRNIVKIYSCLQVALFKAVQQRASLKRNAPTDGVDSGMRLYPYRRHREVKFNNIPGLPCS